MSTFYNVVRAVAVCSAGTIRLRSGELAMHMLARAPGFWLLAQIIGWAGASVGRITVEPEVVESYVRRGLPLFQHTLAGHSGARPEVISVGLRPPYGHNMGVPFCGGPRGGAWSGSRPDSLVRGRT